MQSLIRLVCVAYLVYLTALLLIADPTRLVMGGHGMLPKFLRDLLPEAHLLSFTLLSILTLAARWPIPRWTIVLFLVFYAGATEIAQSFLPPRTAEMKDWMQDIGGISLGILLCWIVSLSFGVLGRLWRKPAKCAVSEMPDDWDTVKKAMLQQPDKKESWWS